MYPVSAFLLTLSLVVPLAVSAETITGNVTYRERLLLPPGARLEVTLQDVSRADVASIELGRTEIDNPPPPPIGFVIEYDANQIDPRNTYSVRARISRDEKLMFVTDTMVPVLTQGAPDHAELLLKMIPAAEINTGIANNHGLSLPATFKGVLPCASCEGIDHHLDLWGDQTYHMRRVWLNGTEPFSRDEIGRWTYDAHRNALILHGASEMPLQWEITSSRRLRQLDLQGQPIVSELPYELESSGALDPTDLSLFVQGMFQYMADAALFTECLTGKSYPVTDEDQYLELERAYLKSQTEPGAPILVTLEATFAERPAMEGPPKRSVIVNRFLNLRPNETCEHHRATAPLTNTYWKILTLGGQRIDPPNDQREPHLILQSGDAPRFKATVGCNQLVGSYQTAENKIEFGPVAATLMACPPELDKQERALNAAISAAARWQVANQELILLGSEGKQLATFVAVYLP